jgi:hypothetical protein
MARGDGSGGDGEDATWLDLVARYDAPVPAEGDGVPWPDREDLAGPVRVSPADALPDGASLSDTGPLPDSLPLPDPADLPGAPGYPDARGFPGGPGLTDSPPFPEDTLSFPGTPPIPARPGGGLGPGRGPRDAPIPEDPADEHYVPPTAPPLPSLNPITKGAWLALFGGPLYLIIATIVGWTVSGLAAFIAVAAFVGGFAVLVLRMDSGPPKDRGPGDGAVV